MSNRFALDEYNSKLAQVYVALEMSKNVAERCVADRPNHHISQALLTLLEVTSHLLEEAISPNSDFENLPSLTTVPEVVM